MPIFSPTIETFLQALTIDRGHLGLVVVKKGPKKLSLPGHARDAAIVNFDAHRDVEAAIGALIGAATRGKWLRVNLIDGALPGRFYNQLRTISTMGYIQAGQVGATGDLIELRWPDEASIVIVSTEKTLEKLPVPTFLNLFGPIMREE